MTISRRALLGLSAALPTALGAPEDELCWLSVTEASELVRKGTVSPVELTRACLQRIERINPKLNAYITTTADRALTQAHTAETEVRRGRWRGPLHGIPIGLKDNIDTGGVRTTAGSALFKDRIPAKDAEVVRRIKRGGAVLLGKTNLDEFAFGHSCRLSYYGPTRNPWKLRNVAGGSSGGSAAAVAAALCYAALGTDTGGSIRQPSAFCGVVGLKPTHSLVSTRGVIPISRLLDHVGPMCRSVHDAALLLQVMCGVEMGLLRQRPSRVRLGIPRAVFYEGLESEVESAIRNALDVLQGLASHTREVTLPLPTISEGTDTIPPPASAERHPASRLWPLVASREAARFHGPLLARSADLYQPEIRSRIGGLIREFRPATYVRARTEVARLRDVVDSVFSVVDVLVTPTTPHVPGVLDAEPPYPRSMRNTMPFNIYGIPAVSIPCGFTATGLPIGLQLIGPRHRDALLLAFAQEYERATDWHKRRPIIEV